MPDVVYRAELVREQNDLPCSFPSRRLAARIPPLDRDMVGRRSDGTGLVRRLSSPTEGFSEIGFDAVIPPVQDAAESAFWLKQIRGTKIALLVGARSRALVWIWVTQV
jgi:hypothetical protein